MIREYFFCCKLRLKVRIWDILIGNSVPRGIELTRRALGTEHFIDRKSGEKRRKSILQLPHLSKAAPWMCEGDLIPLYDILGAFSVQPIQTKSLQSGCSSRLTPKMTGLGIKFHYLIQAKSGADTPTCLWSTLRCVTPLLN
jgi:hypothetical protein